LRFYKLITKDGYDTEEKEKEQGKEQQKTINKNIYMEKTQQIIHLHITKCVF